VASRPPLGVALSDQLGVQQPQYSRGQIIAGILADALAGAAGHPGPMAARWNDERQQQNEEVQWAHHRQGIMDDWVRQQEYSRAHPDPSPMARDVADFQRMTPEQRAAYAEMEKAREGDPIVTITLPNGQMYSGPRSGLATAMMGRMATPQAPVGPLTPINGGPTPSASGGFPR
jgi:hypothetical protein